VKETRNRDRFIKVAERARRIYSGQTRSARVHQFPQGPSTVLDATINVFEALFWRIQRDYAGLEEIVPRFFHRRCDVRCDCVHSKYRPTNRRLYREAFPAMLRLLKALYDAASRLFRERMRSPGTRFTMSWSFMRAPVSRPPLKFYAWQRGRLLS